MSLNPKSYDRLTINGQRMEKDELLEKASSVIQNQETPEWEVDMFRFVNEWLQPDEFMEVTTSGSTGNPKTLRIPKKAMLQSAFTTNHFFALNENHTALLCLSCKYIAGKMMVVRALSAGFNLITVPVSGHPLEQVNQEIDFAAMTPLQMSNELQKAKDRPFLPHTIILGGSRVSRELSRPLKHFPAQIWETYGMTETLSHIALRPVNGPHASDFFQPLPNVQISVDSHDCLVINVPGITDGALSTNDIAELQKDGSFRIKGRRDHVINTGGIKVIPEEIEKELASLLRGAFYIAAAPHPVLGQQLVLITEEKIPNKKYLLKKLKQLLPPYHAPRQIIEKERLPRTETGKIIRSSHQ